jgi:hypothetical protein
MGGAGLPPGHGAAKAAQANVRMAAATACPHTA